MGRILFTSQRKEDVLPDFWTANPRSPYHMHPTTRCPGPAGAWLEQNIIPYPGAGHPGIGTKHPTSQVTKHPTSSLSGHRLTLHVPDAGWMLVMCVCSVSSSYLRTSLSGGRERVQSRCRGDKVVLANGRGQPWSQHLGCMASRPSREAQLERVFR